MAMIVQHNMTAMNTNRQLGVSTGALAKSTEKFQEEYSKHSYTFYQDSPVVNILPFHFIIIIWWDHLGLTDIVTTHP